LHIICSDVGSRVPTAGMGGTHDGRVCYARAGASAPIPKFANIRVDH